MADKATPPKDLTSTLNLRQLRSIPQEGYSADLFNSLNSEQQEEVKYLLDLEVNFQISPFLRLGF
jgi:hypothetical protein